MFDVDLALTRRRPDHALRALVATVLVFAPLAAALADERDGPAVSLEKLLRLPDSYSAPAEARRAGADASQWRERFLGARSRIETARSELEDAKLQMKGLASESAQWQASAPGAAGGDPGESPLSFKLRDRVRAQRDELEAAERSLRELEVEANLAGVPEGWRYAEKPAVQTGR